MSKNIVNYKEIPEIIFPQVGIGKVYTTAAIIMMILHLEGHDNRANIIANVMKEMKIDLEDVEGWYKDSMCNKCGMSKYMHKKNNNGKCF